MKISIKTTTIASFLLAALLISSFSAVMAQTGQDFVENTGHRFIEEYWAMEYDVISGTLVKDYTPGEYADEYDDTTPDRFPHFDANYYIAYVRTGQVQTLYMALSNYSTNTLNNTFTGMAPYQVLQQHYRTPGGDHVIMQNAFAGLLAYEDSGVKNGVPDTSDNVYYGYSLNSEWHKHLLNRYLQWRIGFTPINENRLPKVTPYVIEKTDTGDQVDYKFGINYEDLFVVWYRMDLNQNLNETSSAESLLDKIVAFSFLDSLNFTYIISGDTSTDRPVNITTTTEYDIGEVSSLWIVDEDETKTEEFGGNYFDLWFSSHSISQYNTSAAIEDRLNGDEEVPGMSLAVANYARAIQITGSLEDRENFEYTDEDGEEIDGENANENITTIDVSISSSPAFEIDFASKPNYTLDGGEPMPAPVRLYPTLNIKDKTIRDLDGLTMRFMSRFNREMIKARIERLNEQFDLDGKELSIDIDKQDVFYTICFPEWAGKRINQDPKITVFAEPEDIQTGLGFGDGRIGAFGLGILGLTGISAIILLISKTKKH